MLNKYTRILPLSRVHILYVFQVYHEISVIPVAKIAKLVCRNRPEFVPHLLQCENIFQP